MNENEDGLRIDQDNDLTECVSAVIKFCLEDVFCTKNQGEATCSLKTHATFLKSLTVFHADSRDAHSNPKVMKMPKQHK